MIKRNWIFYFAAAGIIFGLKLFASKAGADGLDWILSPTARWAGILSGLPFYREPGLGYVNHGIRFIIAGSCSGMQFLLITFAALECPFVHRMKTSKGKSLWLAASLAVSFAYTVFVNGFRIAVSILLLNTDTGISWLTPERLHTVEGTLVFLFSLTVIYRGADRVTETAAGSGNTGRVAKIMAKSGGPERVAEVPIRDSAANCIAEITQRSGSVNNYTETYSASGGVYKKIRRAYKRTAPIMWYLLIALVLPFLNNARGGGSEKFTDYAIIILGICGISGIVILAARFLAGFYKGTGR